MTRRVRMLGTVILVGGSLAVSLALAELVLHVSGFPPDITDHNEFSEQDSVLGWRNVANMSKEFISDEYRHQLRFNALGLRGAERVFEKPSNTVRVLLVGDSFVDGASVAEEDRVSDVLERTLNTPGLSCRVEVIALGTGGYSTDQELVSVRQLGLRFAPDVAVLLFYYNDIWYNRQATYFGIPKPHFTFEGDSGVLHRPVLPPRSPTASTKRATEPARATGVIAWFEHHSKLYRLAERTAKSNSALRSLAVRLGLTEVPPEMYDTAGGAGMIPAEFTVFRSSETEQVASAWRATEQLLEHMRRDVEGAGARFRIFHIPIRSRVYARESDAGAIGLGSGGWDLDQVGRRLHEVCARHAFECIDPVPQYVTAADSLGKEGERLYYHMDTHWNAHGNALAARILADHLLPDLRSSARCSALQSKPR